MLNAAELDRMMKPIMRYLFSPPPAARPILVSWFSKLQNALNSAVGFCQFNISTYFANHISVDPHNQTVYNLVIGLGLLFEANQNSIFHLSSQIFYSYHINSRIDPSNEISKLSKSFTRFPYVISLQNKAKICQIESETLMMTMLLSSVVKGFIRSFVTDNVNIEPFFEVNIRRDHLIEDATRQLIGQKKTKYLKKLTVVFDGEAAVDAGGPSREFLYLISEQLFSPDYGMFKVVEDRYLWFTMGTYESNRSFILVGIIIGLAIYNSIVLPIRFPYVLFKKILNPTQKLNLNDLSQIDSSLAKSLMDLQEMKERGDDISDLCLTFQVTYDVFGERVTKPLIEGMEDQEVNNENVDQYIDAYIDFMLVKSIDTQFQGFVKGFKKPCRTNAYSLLDPSEMDILLSGEEVLDWGGLKRSAEYSDGYDANSQAVKWFWEVFNTFNNDEKKQFLKFSTGTDRAPFGGLENVHITFQRSADTNALPVSHTCFNIFTLPDYPSKEILERNVKIAIKYTEGFGFV
ncbi:ubiquitin ligase [Histomonas meleagridis]|uniref:ubiquitin ligase n=1 Tax=Histomonas meleagridis TaxID=135588 RepID=UPI003559D16C|nr:ubiquitin ligase [Histomonas meleagridis]KAH0802189.1 ubiquitin ligase [Histomonas meleagridis]